MLLLLLMKLLSVRNKIRVPTLNSKKLLSVGNFMSFLTLNVPIAPNEAIER